MYKGGASINSHIVRIMRIIGLMVPVVLVLYGFLVQGGVVDNSHYVNNILFYGLMLLWIILATLFILFPVNGGWQSGARLATYHVLAGLYILFVSGFTVSFIAGWILLFIAAYTTFSIVGVQLSCLFFLLITIIDMALHGFAQSVVVADAIGAASVLVVGLTVVAINRIQEVDSAELSRSKAQEVLQRDRILTIVNNLADAVLSTDKDGVVRVYNAASLNLLDTNASLNGRHIDEIMTLRDQDNTPVNLLKMLKKVRSVSVRDDLTFSVEGETLRLEMTCSPIHGNYGKPKRAGTQDGYIIILRDVTKAKSLEEERDEFISVVSHELRTPITIAEGTISNVQVMMDRKNVAENTLKEGISTAHEQVIFLAKMVNDLSTLSRAERGVADAPEEIDVRNLINDLYAEYAPQATKKHLKFNLDLSPRLGKVNASPLYLKELLQNLITNALKYTKEGSVSLHVTRRASKITFDIKDTGIGISKSDQTKIFHKFYRSEDYRTRETGGTGLGLYVAAKLATKLKTKIEMTSRLNHGSSFRITLPVDDEE